MSSDDQNHIQPGLTLEPSNDPDEAIRRRCLWKVRYLTAAIVLIITVFLRWWLGSETDLLFKLFVVFLVLTVGFFYLPISTSTLGCVWFPRRKGRFEFEQNRVRIQTDDGLRIVPYTSFADLQLAYANAASHRVLELNLTLDGEKEPVKVLGDYPMLRRAACEIRRRASLAGNTRDLGDEDGDRTHRVGQKRKAQREACVIAVLMSAFLGFGIYINESGERDRLDILARGQVVQGIVTGPQGNHEIAYAFKDSEGEWRRGAGVVRDNLVVYMPIPVAYLPDNPERNTPVRGDRFFYHFFSVFLLIFILCFSGITLTAVLGRKLVLVGGRIRLLHWRELAEDFMGKTRD